MEWWQVQQLIITIGIVVGVLVPVLALTYRFLVKPSGEKSLPSQTGPAALQQDQRLDHVEHQLEELEGLMRRLVDAAEFDKQLQSGPSSEQEE